MLEFAYLTRYQCRHLANKNGKMALNEGKICELELQKR